MKSIIIIIVLLILILTIRSKSEKLSKAAEENTSKETNLPYTSKFILTKNEYDFYKILKKITDKNELIICPKVGLKDMFEITDKKNYMSWFGRISQKHIDFLICDSMLRPLYAIELDDNSHKQTIEKDEFKNILFETSKVKLLRIKAQMEYTEEYLLENLEMKEIQQEKTKDNITE